MDVIGLTPIDSALSVYGLNVAQVLIESIFSISKLGIVSFAIGLLWCIWEMVQEGSYRKFIVFFFISISGILLLVIPRQVEPVFKSQMEEAGASVVVTAKSLKDSQTSLHNIPVVLSFFAFGADAVVFDLIKVIDQSLSDNKRFIKNPFGLQKLSLNALQSITAPIKDVDLKSKVDDFIYTDYLPTLIIDKNDAHVFDRKEEFKQGLLNMDDSPWSKVQAFFREQGSAEQGVKDALATSIIKGQMNTAKGSLIWPLSLSIYSIFPYILGWANFCLYAAFPILMLFIIIFRRLNIFMRYAELFVWIKSWPLTAAFAHYVSLLAAQVQFKVTSEPSWFWQYPYFALICASLLVLMPVLSLLGIHRGFQFINKLK